MFSSIKKKLKIKLELMFSIKILKTIKLSDLTSNYKLNIRDDAHNYAMKKVKSTVQCFTQIVVAI